MRKSRFTQEQMIRIIRESDSPSQTIEQVARRHGITVTRLYRWKKNFGGMDVSQARRLKDLELENARLKKLLAERDLEVDLMKEINKKKW